MAPIPISFPFRESFSPAALHRFKYRTKDSATISIFHLHQIDQSSVQNITFGVLATCIALATLIVAYLQYQRTVASRSGVPSVHEDQDAAPFNNPFVFEALPPPPPARITSDSLAASGDSPISSQTRAYAPKPSSHPPQGYSRIAALSSTASADCVELELRPSSPATPLALSTQPPFHQSSSSTKLPLDVALEDPPSIRWANGGVMR